MTTVTRASAEATGMDAYAQTTGERSNAMTAGLGGPLTTGRSAHATTAGTTTGAETSINGLFRQIAQH